MCEVLRYELETDEGVKYVIEKKMDMQDGEVVWEVVWVYPDIKLEGEEKQKIVRLLQKHLGVY